MVVFGLPSPAVSSHFPMGSSESRAEEYPFGGDAPWWVLAPICWLSKFDVRLLGTLALRVEHVSSVS